MRVTDRMIYDRAALQTERARAKAEEASMQVATGARVVHPGDDPAAVAGIVSGRAAIARFEALAGVAGRAQDELVQADAALDSVSTAVRRAQQIALQLANGTWKDADAQAAAAEVEGLIGSIAGALNARVAGRYVFGGNHDDAPPFDASGAWSGDVGARRVEIAPGVMEEVSVRTDRAVLGAGGGVDLFATLHALSAALSAGDQDAVRAELDPLAKGLSQVATERARVSATVNVLGTSLEAMRAGRDAAKEGVSALADVDTVEAASNLALSQRALEAAMAASVQSFQLTLLDLLK